MICPKCKGVYINKEYLAGMQTGDYICGDCGHADLKERFTSKEAPVDTELKGFLKKGPEDEDEDLEEEVDDDEDEDDEDEDDSSEEELDN